MSEVHDFTGQVAIVTGAGNGIGRETAYRLARAGARVTFVDRDLASAETALAEIREEIPDAGIAVAADVRDESATRDAVDRTVDRLGRLDILVNNAATWTLKPFKDMTLAEMRNDVDVCLLGTMTMSHAAIGAMITQRSGSIVNLASDAGRIGEPFQVAYGSAKAGVAGLTKGLARELARYGVRVNAVSPGATKTPGSLDAIEKFGGEVKMARNYPLGRIGVPEDIAGAILFFCSSQASWVTGQILSVNGGYSMAD